MGSYARSLSLVDRVAPWDAERVDAKNKVFEYQSGEPVERSQDKPLAEWLS